MSEEKEPFLDKGDDSGKVTRLTLRHGILLPSLFLIIFGASIYSLIVSEWTQNKMKMELFSNSTIQQNTTCGVRNKSDPVYVKYERVQQETAQWSMYYTLAEYIPALFLQLILPSYSDAYGRKYLLIMASSALVIKAAVVAVTVYFSGTLWYIVGVNILEGLLGSSFALFSVAFSFVADITSEKNRSLGVIITETTSLVGAIFGLYFSGYLVENAKLGFFYTSLVATGLCALGFVLLFFLPESLPKNKRSQPKPVLTTVKRMFEFFVSKDFAGKRLSYTFIILVFFFTTLSGMSRGSIETTYFLGQPFCWGPSKISMYMLIRNVVQSVAGIGSVKLWQKCLADEFISILGLTSIIISLIMEAFAQTTLMIYMVQLAGVFSFLAMPMTRSIMSSMTSPDKQGAIFACISTTEVLSTILSSLTGNEIYSYTMSFMNGFVFLIMAFFAALGVVMLIAYRCTKSTGTIAKLNVQDET